jgi:transposase
MREGALREQLERGTKCSCKKTAGTCRRLLKQESDLWTFVWVEGVEPTNNAPKRTLRHGVLWRKSSGRTDSPAGSRFVERMLSVVATCRQQKRNVLEFLTVCCRAQLDGSRLVSAADYGRGAGGGVLRAGLAGFVMDP